MDEALIIALSGWLVSLLAYTFRLVRIADDEQQRLKLANRQLIETKEALARNTDELVRAKERYVLAEESTNAGVWDWNLLTGDYYLSPRWKALLGFFDHELFNRQETFFSRLHSDDEAHLREALRRHLEEEQPFDVEVRLRCKDDCYRWFRSRGRGIRDEHGQVRRLVGSIFDVDEQKRAAEHMDLLMHELSHRSKNLLAVIQAIANQSGRRSASLQEFRNRFSHRLRSLAASHDLLVEQNWKKGDLAELAIRQLAPFKEVDDCRVEIHGPALNLHVGAVQNIGLLFHELATNASKYGALSVPQGHVIITWILDPPETEVAYLRISWKERGGPVVQSPPHKGFGMMVVERMVAEALDGSVLVDFPPQGLTCTLNIPATCIISDHAHSRERAQLPVSR